MSADFGSVHFLVSQLAFFSEYRHPQQSENMRMLIAQFIGFNHWDLINNPLVNT